MFFNKLYCEVEYFPCPHLNQIYEGFNILEKNGFIEVKLIKPKEMNSKKPILKVKLNNKINIIYDTLDGFNWRDEWDKKQNLEFFLIIMSVIFILKEVLQKSSWNIIVYQGKFSL